MTPKQYEYLRQYANEANQVKSITFVASRMLLVTEQAPMLDGTRMIYADVVSSDGTLVHSIEGIG